MQLADTVHWESFMRSIFFAVVALAAPAFATGERVLLTRDAEPFRENICVSMTCVTSGPRDAVVTARSLKEGVELTVKSPSGQVKLVHLTRFSADGDLSSVDVVRASSLAVKAIESSKPLAADPKVGKAPQKAAKLRLLARR